MRHTVDVNSRAGDSAGQRNSLASKGVARATTGGQVSSAGDHTADAATPPRPACRYSGTGVGALVLAAALSLYLATAGGSMATTDAIVAFDVTKGLVERQSLALSGNLLGFESMRGVDGRFYSPFGIAQSIYNIPFYLAGRGVQSWARVRVGGPDTVAKAAVAIGGGVAAALAVWATFLLIVALGRTASDACLGAGLLGAGTLFWPYSKFGFNQPLAALFLALTGVCLAQAANPDRASRAVGAAAGAGAFAGLALLTRHEMGLVAPVAVIYLLLAARGRPGLGWRLAVGFGIVFAGAVAIWAGLNVVRFGNPLDSGLLRDPTPGFGSPVWQGLAGLLFSPGASLFLYSPVIVLALPALWHLWREDRPTAWLLGAPTVLLFLLYAQLGNWVGGRSYGGRYLVPVLPLCCAALPAWIATRGTPAVRRMVAAICLASVAIQVPGVVVDFAKTGVAWARQYPAGQLPDRRYVFTASPLAVNTRAAMTAIPANARYVAGLEAPPSTSREGQEGNREFSQQFAFSLDFWWLYAFYLRLIPAWLAVATGGGLVTAAVTFGAVAWKRATAT
jgi:hypothetical protein